jgi:heavy metal sensor kinase
MTRRIALAILLTVWAILIAGCATAYLTMRWMLIDQLDQSLQVKASTLPQLRRLTGSSVGDAEERTLPGSPATVRDLPASLTSAGAVKGDRYVIKNASGQTLSPATGGLMVSDVKVIDAAFTTLADGTRMRSLTLQASAPGPGGTMAPVSIMFQGSAESLDQMLDRLALSLSVFGLLAGLITALVALRVSRAALRPLYATADVIGAIDSNNLHRRIQIEQLPPELLPMASRLNEMLERIETAYAQRHQFLADASHELRTPVTALVTTAEVSLRYPRDAASYQSTLASCLQDARLLRRLVERLMEQCRADTLSHDETPREIDLTPLLEQCADQAAMIARERQITLNRALPASLHIVTQEQRLRSVVTNLLSNAVEYNRPDGSVDFRAAAEGAVLRLTVRDTGPGIDPEHLPHLFEPFYRADRARSVETGHLGLGLSLVQAHVRALGGEIRVESGVGAGTTFQVLLPLATIPTLLKADAAAPQPQPADRPLIGLSHSS